MNCPFCGKTFSQRESEKTCKGCAMFGGCKKIKCPHCGYESPAEPKSAKWLKRLIGKSHEQKSE